MTQAKICILIAIVLYLGLVLYIGYRCSKKNKNTDDFYLGGRKLGPFVTAMSAEASDMSSYLLMGIPGLAYLSGIADAGWTIIGLSIGTYLNFLIVAKKLRRYSKIADNAITLPQFFKNRYHDSSNSLLFIAAIVIVVFFIPYTASGFAACGKLFSSLFGVNYMAAMIVSAIVIVGYTTLGGFLAASTTDLIQSIIMTIALIVVLLFGVNVAGGFDVVLDNAKSLSGYLTMFATHNAADGTSAPYGFITIISTLAWGLGYFGMPHILLRFMAIEDEEKLSISRRVAIVWVVISMAVAVLIGIVGYSMSVQGAIDTLSGADSETIIVKAADLMSQNGVIMALIAGVILAGIMASTMSTADSQLLAASSAGGMVAARITLLVISVFAVILARDPNSSVFGIVSFAWAGFGAAFGPVVLFSLFWRRANRFGALAGMVSGGLMIFVWKYLVRPLGGVWDIYELLPAFIVACIFIVAVSLATPAPEQKVLDEFDLVSGK